MRRAKVLYILLLFMPLMSKGARQFPDEPRPWQWSPSRTTMSTSPPREFAWWSGGEFSTLTSENKPLPETTHTTIQSTESTTQSTSSSKITEILTQNPTSSKITEILTQSTTPSKITEILTQSTTPSKITDTLTQILEQNTNKISQEQTTAISLTSIDISQTTIITPATQSSSINIVTTKVPESSTSLSLNFTEILVLITGEFSSRTTNADNDDDSPMIKNITESTENVLFSTGNEAKNPNAAMNPNPHRGMISTRITENREELTSQGNIPGVSLTTINPDASKKKQPELSVNKLPFDFENQNTFAFDNKVTPEFGNKIPTFSETVTKQNINANRERDTGVKNSDNPEFDNRPNQNPPSRDVPGSQRFIPSGPQNNPGSSRNVPFGNGNVNPPDVGGGGARGDGGRGMGGGGRGMGGGGRDTGGGTWGRGSEAGGMGGEGGGMGGDAGMGGGGDDEMMPTRSFKTTIEDKTTEYRDKEVTTDRSATEIWSFRPTEEMTAMNPNWTPRPDGRVTTPRSNSKTTSYMQDDMDAERVPPTRASVLPRMPATQFIIVKKDPNDKREGWNRHSVLGVGD